MGKRILVPLDGSEQSTKALKLALEDYPDSEITALHIVNPLKSIYDEVGMEPPIGQSREERAEELKQAATDFLEEAETIAERYDTEIETTIETGDPQNTIINYATENEFDHIIMGSHGRTGGARILIGSVAETVVRRSQVPVTIVR